MDNLECVKVNCSIDENQCWNWEKALHHTGYGQTFYEGKNISSHRLSYILVNGEIPEKLVIRHKCNNKRCCNPEHLELGTQSDNMLDFTKTENYSPKFNRKLQSIVQKIHSLEERVEFYLENSEYIKSCLIPSILKPRVRQYFTIGFKGKRFLLHRLVLSYKLNKEYSEIDIARHLCHNKQCINPNHLEEGSRSDNAKDSTIYSNATKLTKENINLVLQDMKNYNFDLYGVKTKFDNKWSNTLNVNRITISRIRNKL